MTPAQIQQIIDDIQLPAIEIAGPSPRGYKILEKLHLTVSNIHITNTSKEVTVYTADDTPLIYTVDEIADVQHLQYEDNSVGILLASYLPAVDQYLEMSSGKIEKKVNEEYERALKTELISPANFMSLHIALLSDAARVLTNRGLLILQGVHEKDTVLAKKLGLVPLIAEHEEAETESQIYVKQKDFRRRLS